MPTNTFHTDISPERFPPPYRVRISQKAKRISLRIHPQRGLEVVLPSGTCPSVVPGVLLRFRPWIEKHQHQLHTVNQQHQPFPTFPFSFFLYGHQELVTVGSSQAVAPLSPRERLALAVPAVHHERILTSEHCRSLYLPARLAEEYPTHTTPRQIQLWLREWIREEARCVLTKQLSSLAQANGLQYSSISIRFQKTRWGSCTSKGAISLNASLIFLPHHYIRYILAHELCHTKQLNHSEKFWQLLFTIEPQAMQLSRLLRHAGKYIPYYLGAQGIF